MRLRQRRRQGGTSWNLRIFREKIVDERLSGPLTTCPSWQIYVLLPTVSVVRPLPPMIVQGFVYPFLPTLSNRKNVGGFGVGSWSVLPWSPPEALCSRQSYRQLDQRYQGRRVTVGCISNMIALPRWQGIYLVAMPYLNDVGGPYAGVTNNIDGSSKTFWTLFFTDSILLAADIEKPRKATPIKDSTSSFSENAGDVWVLASYSLLLRL